LKDKKEEEDLYFITQPGFDLKYLLNKLFCMGGECLCCFDKFKSRAKFLDEKREEIHKTLLIKTYF
jgi:hypothetical protein